MDKVKELTDKLKECTQTMRAMTVAFEEVTPYLTEKHQSFINNVKTSLSEYEAFFDEVEVFDTEAMKENARQWAETLPDKK